MSERASSRTSSQVSALLAQLNKPRSRAPRVVGALTYLVGFVDIATGLARGWQHRLHPLIAVLPGAVAAASAATIVSGILLLLLAHGLKRRKHRAWLAALLLLASSVVLHAVKLEFLAAAMSLTVLGVLIAYRAEFRALGDPQTPRRQGRLLPVRGVAAVAPSPGAGHLGHGLEAAPDETLARGRAGDSEGTLAGAEHAVLAKLTGVKVE